MTIYGIPNCDIMKKAMKWLTANHIQFSFHDYKKEGISQAKLEEWCNKAGWENVLNKRSTTWRELSATEQEKITGQPAAIKLMMNNTSIIKRPLLENGKQILIGFSEKEYAGLLK